jgi:hypothetical protein
LGNTELRIGNPLLFFNISEGTLLRLQYRYFLPESALGCVACRSPAQCLSKVAIVTAHALYGGACSGYILSSLPRKNERGAACFNTISFFWNRSVHISAPHVCMKVRLVTKLCVHGTLCAANDETASLAAMQVAERDPLTGAVYEVPGEAVFTESDGKLTFVPRRPLSSFTEHYIYLFGSAFKVRLTAEEVIAARNAANRPRRRPDGPVSAPTDAEIRAPDETEASPPEVASSASGSAGSSHPSARRSGSGSSRGGTATGTAPHTSRSEGGESGFADVAEATEEADAVDDGAEAVQAEAPVDGRGDGAPDDAAVPPVAAELTGDAASTAHRSSRGSRAGDEEDGTPAKSSRSAGSGAAARRDAVDTATADLPLTSLVIAEMTGDPSSMRVGASAAAAAYKVPDVVFSGMRLGDECYKFSTGVLSRSLLRAEPVLVMHCATEALTVA